MSATRETIQTENRYAQNAPMTVEVHTIEEVQGIDAIASWLAYVGDNSYIVLCLRDGSFVATQVRRPELSLQE